MIRLERIVAAVDFSDHTETVLQYAAELAKVFGAEVVLCHVVESPDAISQLPPGGEGYFPPNMAQLQEKQAREDLNSLIAAHSVERARIAIRQGPAFVEIVRLAREEDADLVIVGTHGRGAIAHLLLGSVAEKVVRKAPCPVLTVRRGEHEFVMP